MQLRFATHLHFGEDEGLLGVGAVVGLVEVAHGSAVEVHRAAPPHVDALVVPHEGGALATDINGVKDMPNKPREGLLGRFMLLHLGDLGYLPECGLSGQ